MKCGSRTEPLGTQQSGRHFRKFHHRLSADKMDCCVTRPLLDTHTVPPKVTVSERFSQPAGTNPARKQRTDWCRQAISLASTSICYHITVGTQWMKKDTFALCWFPAATGKEAETRRSTSTSQHSHCHFHELGTGPTLKSSCMLNHLTFLWREQKLHGVALLSLARRTCCINLRHFSQQKRTLSCWYIQKVIRSRNRFL